MKNLSRHTDLLCELETLLLMRRIQIREMSKLGWLIRLVKHFTWADSLYFLYLPLLSISSLLYNPRPMHDELTLIFLEDPARDYVCVHGGARLEVCLFRECSSGYIHMEYCRCTVSSVADLFPAWFS
jgi:hypothetical protein